MGTDLIMMDLDTAHSDTMDTSLPAVTVDLVMAVDSVMVAADMTSPIPDTANRIAADPRGHRISRTIVCREISRIRYV
jgi:hypothetical protein